MLFANSPRLLPHASSSPARHSFSCFATSAPRAVEAQIGPRPLRRRPLAGCRLSRETIQVVLPVGWPWSPFLPAACQRLRPTFVGLVVLCDHPTPLVPWSCRPFVLHDYRPRSRGGGREVSPGKNAKLRTKPSPLPALVRRIWGFAESSQLTLRAASLTALRFRSIPYCTYELPSGAGGLHACRVSSAAQSPNRPRRTCP